MKIKCEGCGKTLKKPGAILLSPPTKKKVTKLHLCDECYSRSLKLLKTPCGKEDIRRRRNIIYYDDRK